MTLYRLFSFLRLPVCALLLPVAGSMPLSGQTEMIVNGDFESGLSSWQTNDFDSDGISNEISSSLETQDPIAGSQSARIQINNTDPPNDEWWHLNFRQLFNVQEGRVYAGTYQIRASKPCTILVQMLETSGAFRSIAYTEVKLDTGVQSLRVAGSSSFTGQAQINFALGKVESPATIWIDEVSVIERPAGSDTASVTVDFAGSDPETPAPADLSGLLLGLDITNLNDPPAQLVTPLQPATWRVRPTTGYMEKVTEYGSLPIVLLSEGWYPGANLENPTTPWDDNFVAWQAHCQAVVNEVLSNPDIPDNVVYDIWNEPDHPTFFTNWPDGTWANFLDTFGAAHDAIRAVDPDAIIAGPSTSADFPWPLLDQFMDAAVVRGWTVDILATHLFGDTDVTFEQMRDDLLKLRTDYIENPTYSTVGIQQYMATEYGNPGSASAPGVVFRPGSLVAMLRFMEEGLVEGAMRSTWDIFDPGTNTAFDGSLGGLIDKDSGLPRALWWALRWYALGAGNRVATSSDNPELVPLASLDAGTPANSQILLASRSYSRDAPAFASAQLTLEGLDTAGIAPASGSVTLWIYRAANADGASPVETPELLANPTLSVSGGSASTTLTGIGAYDVVYVRFSPADIPGFAPDNAWTGAGADDDLNNPDNWGGGTVPAAGQTVIFGGYEGGDLDLTFSANTGGNTGWLLDVEANQTGNLTFRNSSASMRNFRILSGAGQVHEIADGAGAVTFGTASGTANPIQFVIGSAGGALQINNNSANPLVFGSNVSFASGGAQPFDLALYGTGVTEICGPFSTNTTNASGWLRVRNGTVRLLGDLQHEGGVLADSGVLEFDSTAALGSGNFLRIGQDIFNGTVRYTGDSAATVSRTVSIGNGAQAHHTGDATVESSGAGAVTFSANPFNLSANQHSGVTRTLTLGGASAAANTIAGAIQNNASGNGAVALRKAGAGTWVLGGANTYTGPTDVEAGTLLVEGSTAAASAITVSSGAFLGGSGTVNGNVVLADGAGIVFDAGDGLTASGASVDLGNLAIARIAGLDASAAPGAYTLIGGSAAFDFSAVANLGPANAAQLGPDRHAWFEEGSLILRVADDFGLWAAEEGLGGADAEASADPDGDGLTNEEEYITGTDPNDPSSRYAVSATSVDASADPPQFSITFGTVPGRTYQVRTTTDLADPDSWSDLGSSVSGDGNPKTVTADLTAANVFYRVQVSYP